MERRAVAPLVINAVILLAVAGIAWVLISPRPLFKVRVRNGQAEAVRGTVKSDFLHRVAELAAADEIRSATICGYANGSLIRLRFSGEVTPGGRQKLLNWWASFGWRPPKSQPK